MKKRILLLAMCLFCLGMAWPVQAAMKFEDLTSDYRGAVLETEASVYKDHSKSSEVFTELKYGENVRILKEAKKWYYVKTSEGKGYVQKNQLVKYNKKKKHIALTFDDGPSTANTPTVLKALKKYNCHATFFVLGNLINETSGKLLKQAHDLGCDIGSHSYSHKKLTGMSAKEVSAEASKTDKMVKKYTGEAPALFRAPYGSTNKTVLSAFARAHIYWSVDTEDWKYRDTSRLISYVGSHAGDGKIVLMHDIHSTTVKAVDSILKNLTNKGYEMVTVRELAAIKGEKLKKGTTYYSFK